VTALAGLLASGSGSGSGMPGMSGSSMKGMAGMGAEPPVNLHNLLTRWQGGPFSIGVAVVLVAVLAWYLRATRRVEARGRRWHHRRTLSFTLGLVAIEVALGSSVAVFTNYTFEAHVIQHLLLMIIAPPLLALGAPMTLVLQTVRRPLKVRILQVLHSRPFGVISHPVPVFFFYYLAMFAFFLTGALNFAMLHMWSMDLINIGFLAGATLYWWPMVGLDPIVQWKMSPGFKMLNILVGILPESFLGIALLSAATPAASMYSLTSTHTGGGVLWAASEVAGIAALAPVFSQWFKADTREGKRIDARIDAGEMVGSPGMEAHGLAASLRSIKR
jgi:putative membrane protein